MRFDCYDQVATTSRDGRVVVFDINAGSMPSCLVSEIEARSNTAVKTIWRRQQKCSPRGVKGQPQLNPGLDPFDFPKNFQRFFVFWAFKDAAAGYTVCQAIWSN